MYIGEMILLHGHLYRFGTGFFYDGLPAVTLAPVDLLVILASSGLMLLLLLRIAGSSGNTSAKASATAPQNGI